jgi:hypothetical protein
MYTFKQLGDLIATLGKNSLIFHRNNTTKEIQIHTTIEDESIYFILIVALLKHLKDTTDPTHCEDCAKFDNKITTCLQILENTEGKGH